MKISVITTLILFFSILPIRGQESKRITILHTNDFHSHLQGFAPESAYTPGVPDNDLTVGGFSRMAALISSVREENPGRTLVVDAGDCLMGTFFHTLEPATGFQLPLMRQAGYDIVALGNHDFDFGPDKYTEIVRNSLKRGEIPVMLLGNVVTDPDDPGDDSFAELMKVGLVSPYTVSEINGIKIGIFSLMGKDADESAPYAPPLTFSNIIRSARSMVKTLKKEGCEVIICLSHSGIVKDKKGRWSGEDVKLARKVRGIDLIISAHMHRYLAEPLMVKGTPIVAAGSLGMYMGKAELSLSSEGARLENYTSYKIDDTLPADTVIQAAIESQKKMVEEAILKPVGLTYDMPVASAPYSLVFDEYGDVSSTNLPMIVVDAIYYYMNTSGPGTDIALVNAGMIRDQIEPGIQSVADIFRTMSLGSGNDAVPGYALSQLWFTGRELKKIAEVLIMASSGTPAYYPYFSHIRFEYDPGAGPFNKVKRIEFTDHEGNVREVSTLKDDSTLYSVVASSYILDFFGVIKKKSFGLVNAVPKDKDGNQVTDMDLMVVDFDPSLPGIQEGKEWLAMVKYLQQFSPETEGGLPVIPDYYQNPPRSLAAVSPEK